MRALFVSTYFPEHAENVNGTYQRMEMFVEAFCQLADLEMLFLVPSSVDVSPSSVARHQKRLSEQWGKAINLNLCHKTEVPKLRSRTNKLASVVKLDAQPDFAGVSGPKVREVLSRALQSQPDFVFVHRMTSMVPFLEMKDLSSPVILDLDDVEHLKMWRRCRNCENAKERFLYLSRIPVLFMAERKAICRARQAYVCSTKDRDYLRSMFRTSSVELIPNSARSGAMLPLPEQPTLLFLGSYRYRPNAEAAEFLIDRVWPLIHQLRPDAHLIIAGAEPEKIQCRRAPSPNIEFCGFVEDLESLYRRSRVVTAPILTGGGTRIKLLEAAFYGRPMVATSVGAEGLLFQNGREIFLRDDPQSFAQACLKLLNNSLLCKKMAGLANAIVRRHYERSRIVELIRSKIRDALESHIDWRTNFPGVAEPEIEETLERIK